MKYIVTNEIRLSLPPEGPLAKHLPLLADFFKSQGYQPSTVHIRVRFSADFSRWLEQRKIRLHSINSDHARKYLKYRKGQGTPCFNVPITLKHVINFLYHEKILSPQAPVEPPKSSVDTCLWFYAKYLREDRALAETTISFYTRCAERFLDRRFEKRQVILSNLCATDVIDFIQFQASRLQPAGSKAMSNSLRSFLKYVLYRGEITLDLAAAVPSVAHWAMPSIPRAISADQVSELLDSIEQKTAIGLRDYAIILLLARLGLRACEIAFLKLGHINWNEGTFTVHGKAGRQNSFPLSHEIGEAIAAYLTKGRPPCHSPYVFLRTQIPIGAFTQAGSIGAIVRYRLKRTTIKAPTWGAHQFRHGFATDMLHREVSLSEIGGLLGHHCPQSTMIYAKTDIESLRRIAMPWPGEI